jgi:hypothetical protein
VPFSYQHPITVTVRNAGQTVQRASILEGTPLSASDGNLNIKAPKRIKQRRWTLQLPRVNDEYECSWDEGRLGNAQTVRGHQQTKGSMLTKAAGTSDVQNSTGGSLEYRASKENQEKKKRSNYKGKQCLVHATSSPTARGKGGRDIPYKAKCRQVIIVWNPDTCSHRTKPKHDTRPTSSAQMFISDFRHIELPMEVGLISRQRRYCPDWALGVVIIEIEQRALCTENICQLVTVGGDGRQLERLGICIPPYAVSPQRHRRDRHHLHIFFSYRCHCASDWSDSRHD